MLREAGVVSDLLPVAAVAVDDEDPRFGIAERRVEESLVTRVAAAWPRWSAM